MWTNFNSIIPKLTLNTLISLLAQISMSKPFLTSNHDSNITLNIVIIENKDSIVTDVFSGLDLFFLAFSVQPGRKNYGEGPSNILNSNTHHQVNRGFYIATQYNQR